MNELQRCPFCGSEDLMMNKISWAFFINCNHCESNGPLSHYGSEKTAKEIWNKRNKCDE